MKKLPLITPTLFFIILMNTSFFAQELTEDRHPQKVIYFNPEIFPKVEEIRAATYAAFFSSVTDRFSTIKNTQVLRVEAPMSYENIDSNSIMEFCLYNDAQYAIVPKVKFFKVGIGKYVFSSQVIVSMKLFDYQGNLLATTSYDTYRKNARMLGSAENSIKIGTNGALKNLLKKNKYLKRPNN